MTPKKQPVKRASRPVVRSVRPDVLTEIERAAGLTPEPPRAVPSGALYYGEPQDDPRVAGWLVPDENCTALGYDIICRAYCDIGICEQPEGSNRGIRIENMTKRWGSPVPSSWCGLWVMSVWADRGALVPKWGADIDNWRGLVKPEWRLTISTMLRASPAVQRYLIGAAILYGTDTNLYHIGIISRITANRVFTIEGNRGFAGGVTNNGEWVNMEPSGRHDVWGIVIPQRSPEYVPKKQIVRWRAA